MTHDASLDQARLSGGKVLVHCYAGRSRSAAVTIAYFVDKLNMTLDQAYCEIRAKRACISPNLNFMGQLQKYEEFVRSKAVGFDCGMVEAVQAQNPAVQSC